MAEILHWIQRSHSFGWRGSRLATPRFWNGGGIRGVSCDIDPAAYCIDCSSTLVPSYLPSADPNYLQDLTYFPYHTYIFQLLPIFRILLSGVNLIWNLGVMDPDKKNRKISIFQAILKNLEFSGKNWTFTATSWQIILYLFKSHHFQTYFLYM